LRGLLEKGIAITMLTGHGGATASDVAPQQSRALPTAGWGHTFDL